MIKDPNLKRPNNIKIIPDKIIEIVSPIKPYVFKIVTVIRMKVAEGPPIWTRLPPNKAIKKPPIIAEWRPFSGETPEAIAKAIDKGRAIIYTTSTALKSLKN